MVVSRWRWVTLVCSVAALFVACGEAKHQGSPKAAAAGKSGAGMPGSGGTVAEGGGSGEAEVGGSASGSAGRSSSSGGLGSGGAGGGGAGGGAGSGVVGGSPGVAGAPAAGSGALAGGGGIGGGDRPPSWKCGSLTYADGQCHCGCGAVDPDCQAANIEACEVCNAPGSCNGAPCPGRIEGGDIGTCVPTPNNWTCLPETYEDEQGCDCGCGVVDPDCADETVESCDVCWQTGSCANALCPSSITPDNNAHCAIPPEWKCYDLYYGDNECDCGCGAVDVDCADDTVESCSRCPPGSCGTGYCSANIEPENNALCATPPANWLCSPRLWNNGTCDCGCGFFDFDCAEDDIEFCENCDAEGSCSGPACPGTIVVDQIAFCKVVPAPAGWTCWGGDYANGRCDCGCGVPDLDCRTSDRDACLSCYGVGCDWRSCETSVDPDDTTQCLPPPAGWTCDAAAFYDQLDCDCGCGVLDPDCDEFAGRGYCDRCPAEGCAGGNCNEIKLNDTTSCVAP